MSQGSPTQTTRAGLKCSHMWSSLCEFWKRSNTHCHFFSLGIANFAAAPQQSHSFSSPRNVILATTQKLWCKIKQKWNFSHVNAQKIHTSAAFVDTRLRVGCSPTKKSLALSTRRTSCHAPRAFRQTALGLCVNIKRRFSYFTASLFAATEALFQRPPACIRKREIASQRALCWQGLLQRADNKCDCAHQILELVSSSHVVGHKASCRPYHN